MGDFLRLSPWSVSAQARALMDKPPGDHELFSINGIYIVLRHCEIRRIELTFNLINGKFLVAFVLICHIRYCSIFGIHNLTMTMCTCVA